MNAKQLRYVMTLAQEGSFSRAAEGLGITQPSLSQFIKKLEKELGIELFDRSGRDVCLTDAGRAYLEIGRKTDDLEHQLEGILLDLSTFKRGSIRVGISAHRAMAFMPSIVGAFKKQYPGICLYIVERYRRELIEAAEQGEFDLCLTTLPIEDELFKFETVLIEENVIAIPTNIKVKATHDDNRAFPTIDVKQINGIPFAMLNETHLMQRELEKLAKRNKLNLRAEVVCTSLQTLIEMVKEGIGAAYIPACLEQ